MREDINNCKMSHDAEAAISAAHLLHPGRQFSHPRDVLAADHIGDEEKRAILASWASDIFAVESIPALRLYPGTDKAVSYDEIVEALKTLDRLPGKQDASNNHRCRRRRVQLHRFGGLGLCSYRKGGRHRQPFEI